VTSEDNSSPSPQPSSRTGSIGENPNQALLPLPKRASKILVAGSHADNLGYQCGGWTIEWQGVTGNNVTTGIL